MGLAFFPYSPVSSRSFVKISFTAAVERGWTTCNIIRRDVSTDPI
jgi:hypothetical protein